MGGVRGLRWGRHPRNGGLHCDRSLECHRLPRPGAGGLPRADRCRRRARPAGAAAGRRAGRGHLRRARREGGCHGGVPRPHRDRGGGAGRLRLAQQRASADCVLRRVRLRPGAGADQLPALGGGGGLHRRAQRCARPVRRPRARGAPGRRRVRAQVPDRARRPAVPARRRAEAVGARRERHRHDQLHLGHDSTTQGRADHPPQPLDQRGHLRAARRCHRPRRLPAHPADVPRQRLGDAVRDDRHGRQARGAAQGRRRRDPAPGAAARRDRDVRRARCRQRRARRGGDLGR